MSYRTYIPKSWRDDQKRQRSEQQGRARREARRHAADKTKRHARMLEGAKAVAMLVGAVILLVITTLGFALSAGRRG